MASMNRRRCRRDAAMKAAKSSRAPAGPVRPVAGTLNRGLPKTLRPPAVIAIL
jgi:hypothetical protein